MAVQNVGNVLMGPATIYAGATGVITAAPTDANVNSTPAASAWTDIGASNGGVSWTVTPKFTPLVVDQVVDNIDDRLTSRDIMVTLTLAEMTLTNLALAINTTIGATGANFGTLEPNYGPFASQTLKTSFLIDGFAPVSGSAPANARRRLYIPRAQQTGKVEWLSAKDKEQGILLTLKAYYVSTTVSPVHITDQQA
jgi:hypothetical protein